VGVVQYSTGVGGMT